MNTKEGIKNGEPTTPSFTEHIKEPRHMTLEIQILAWDRPTRNVREYRRGNQKWTIQRNWQHRVHNTKIHKNTTQYV